MLFVVDTWSLRVLEKLNWLDELSHPEDTFLSTPKVVHELKEHYAMKMNISLPDTLVAELDGLLPKNGRASRNRMIQKLLRESIQREKQMRVAQLYCKGKKTLRQCAEMLGVDVIEMMDILYNLNISLDCGGRSVQSQLALKIARQIRNRKTS
jgi:hypothetical protein